MNILQALVRLRDDLKLWVTNNLQALKEEIDSKSTFSGEYDDEGVGEIAGDIAKLGYAKLGELILGKEA